MRTTRRHQNPSTFGRGSPGARYSANGRYMRNPDSTKQTAIPTSSRPSSAASRSSSADRAGRKRNLMNDDRQDRKPAHSVDRRNAGGRLGVGTCDVNGWCSDSWPADWVLRLLVDQR